MMLDWSEYERQIFTAIGEIGKVSADTVHAVMSLNAAGEKTGALDPKTRELIAIAVAATRQCDGCIAVHMDAAVKKGATREEIVEALGVAIAVNAGTALVYSCRALEAYKAMLPSDASAA